MTFIHHYHDHEAEVAPPYAVKRAIMSLKDQGILRPPERVYLSSLNPSPSRVMAKPHNMGSDYWEVIIEEQDQ